MQGSRTLEAVGDARAAAEIQKTGAAAHGNVLAVIDAVARFRVHKRSSPAAETVCLFEQFDVEPALSGGDRGGQSRQPAADDRNGWSV